MGVKRSLFRLLPPGALLITALGGLMTLSAIIYYKAEKTHRYLEPSLAISEPGIEFNQNLRSQIEKEFGNEYGQYFIVVSESIFVNSSRIFGESAGAQNLNMDTMRRISRIFLGILENQNSRPDTDLILVILRLPESPHADLSESRKAIIHNTEERILNALLDAEPLLRKNHRYLFAAFTLTGPFTPDASDWVEFRMIRNRPPHIDMIETLRKYLR